MCLVLVGGGGVVCWVCGFFGGGVCLVFVVVGVGGGFVVGGGVLGGGVWWLFWGCFLLVLCGGCLVWDLFFGLGGFLDGNWAKDSSIKRGIDFWLQGGKNKQKRNAQRGQIATRQVFGRGLKRRKNRVH